MPIKVSCKCGQSFMAKDELAGQTLLCPKCHEPLTITAGAQQPAHRGGGGIEDLLEEVGIKAYEGPRCPRCAAPLKPNAVLCVSCGYHLQAGEQIKGASVRKAGERGHGAAAEELLDRAAQRIVEEKLEEKKARSQGLPAWAYLIALALMSGFCVSMFMIPKDQAFRISGWTLFGVANLAVLYYQVRILIVAFQESATCGLLYLFLPFYALYYVFTRWDHCGGLFLMSVGAHALSWIGQLIIMMAPWVAEKDEGKGAWLPTAPPYAVVAAAPDGHNAFHCTQGNGGYETGIC